MATLPEDPSMGEIQLFISQIVKERGWENNTISELYLLFSEEVGELARAIRDHTNLKSEKKTNKLELEEEFADVLSYLADLANRFDVDLAKALRDKQTKNQTRQWH